MICLEKSSVWIRTKQNWHFLDFFWLDWRSWKIKAKEKRRKTHTSTSVRICVYIFTLFCFLLLVTSFPENPLAPARHWKRLLKQHTDARVMWRAITCPQWTILNCIQSSTTFVQTKLKRKSDSFQIWYSALQNQLYLKNLSLWFEFQM